MQRQKQRTQAAHTETLNNYKQTKNDSNTRRACRKTTGANDRLSVKKRGANSKYDIV